MLAKKKALRQVVQCSVFTRGELFTVSCHSQKVFRDEYFSKSFTQNVTYLLLFAIMLICIADPCSPKSCPEDNKQCIAVNAHDHICVCIEKFKHKTGKIDKNCIQGTVNYKWLSHACMMYINKAVLLFYLNMKIRFKIFNLFHKHMNILYFQIHVGIRKHAGHMHCAEEWTTLINIAIANPTITKKIQEMLLL